MESYPVVPLFAGVLLLTVGCTWLLFRREIRRAGEFGTWQWKAAVSPAYLFAHPGLLPAPAVQHPIPAKRQHLCQRAASHRSLQVLRRIYEERTQLSAVLPDPTAERGRSQRTRDLREYRRQPAPHSRQPGYAAPQHRADHHREHERLVHAAFRLSGRDHAPPGLSLQNGDRFRTVFRHRQPHGAGTRSRYPLAPPCPGQSIIKRPRNDNMHSTAAVLREKGYDAYYFYGGNSYFDNMETFFGGNGYRIIDQKSYKPEEITFANIWGVCDEDAYDKSDPLARRAGRYDRSALLRPRHDGQQPPALHLPGRPDSDSERCETALRRRHVHRLRIGTLLRRGQPPTLVRQHGFRHYGRPLRLECRQNRNPAGEIPHSRPDLRSGTHHTSTSR